MVIQISCTKLMTKLLWQFFFGKMTILRRPKSPSQFNVCMSSVTIRIGCVLCVPAPIITGYKDCLEKEVLQMTYNWIPRDINMCRVTHLSSLTVTTQIQQQDHNIFYLHIIIPNFTSFWSF